MNEPEDLTSKLV